MNYILTTSSDQHKTCKPEPQKSTNNQTLTNQCPYKRRDLTTTCENLNQDLRYKLSSTKWNELGLFLTVEGP
jgi:hypothetical protein